MSNQALDPMIWSTQMDLAWDAWQKAFDAGGVLLPSRAKFDAWWGIAVKYGWKHLRDLMEGAWGSGVQDRNEQGTAGFNSWWQAIVDTTKG